MSIDFSNDSLSYLLNLRDEAINRSEEEIESGDFVPVFILDSIYFIPRKCLNNTLNL